MEKSNPSASDLKSSFARLKEIGNQERCYLQAADELLAEMGSRVENIRQEDREAQIEEVRKQVIQADEKAQLAAEFLNQYADKLKYQVAEFSKILDEMQSLVDEKN